MYNLQTNIDRIISLTHSKNLSINQMLKNAGLATSILDNMKRGRLPSVDKIQNIADYLDCSVDYLLGRIETPETPEETTLLKIYRSLNEKKQYLALQKILEIANDNDFEINK